MTPSVTVLMAVYNAGNYLKGAVNSLLQQDFKDFELLIVDDASSDTALAAVSQMNDPRVRVHTNPVNLGQTRSLNVGLGLAKGEFIARMDADDAALPQWLSRQLEFMAAHPSRPAVVSTRAGVIDENNRLLRILNTPLKEDDIRLKSLWASPINHVGSLMRRDALEKVGGYDERFTIAADYDLWVRLLQEGFSLAVCPHVSVLIRIHQKSYGASNRLNREVPEAKDVVLRAVKNICGRTLTEKEVELWLKGNYQPESLSPVEFEQLLTLAAQLIQAAAGISPEARSKHLKQLVRTLKAKRLVAGRPNTAAFLYRFWARQSAKLVLKNKWSHL